MKPLAERLAGHDVVLLAGAQVFRYHPHIPGPILPPGTRLLHLTDDPDEAARAAAGFSIVGDVRVGLERLAELVPDADRPGPSPRPAPGAPPPTEPMSVGYVFRALASALPADAVVVEESVSSRAAFYDQIRIERTSSYFATGSGGLGFALPAAVGIGLARPGTPVVCIAGDGSTMFGVHAIWTAAQHEVPVIFVVVNNGHYGILKAFAAFQRTPGVPGLDLPGLDIPLIARGLGADACRISSRSISRNRFRMPCAPPPSGRVRSCSTSSSIPRSPRSSVSRCPEFRAVQSAEIERVSRRLSGSRSARHERLVAEAAHWLLDGTAPATRQPRRADVVRHRLGSLLIRVGSKLQGADLIDPSLTAASVATAVSGL